MTDAKCRTQAGLDTREMAKRLIGLNNICILAKHNQTRETPTLLINLNKETKTPDLCLLIDFTTDTISETKVETTAKCHNDNIWLIGQHSSKRTELK